MPGISGTAIERLALQMALQNKDARCFVYVGIDFTLRFDV